MAASHAATTMAQHQRADGSTYHLVDFDPTTGQVLSKKTVQGYSDTSTWARGQSWALYGFTTAYQETGNDQFRTAAERAAEYYLAHLPSDFVPYWDFEVLRTATTEHDTSSAATAASGLLELSQFAPTPEQRQRYLTAAEAILASLSTETYLTRGSNSLGFLLHGTGNRPHNSEVDVSLIYGDYYFIEALLRLQRIVERRPLFSTFEDPAAVPELNSLAEMAAGLAGLIALVLKRRQDGSAG